MRHDTLISTMDSICDYATQTPPHINTLYTKRILKPRPVDSAPPAASLLHPSNTPSDAASFPRFSQLPPELRQHIWRAALSEWSVWAPTHGHFHTCLNPVITMAPLGHCSAYTVGQACSESRQLMKRTYTKLLSDEMQSGEDEDTAPSYWVHPQRTIYYLGCSQRATDFIEILHAHERLSVDHIVLRVCQDWVEVSRFVYVLARYCPGVKTLVLHSTTEVHSTLLRERECWCDWPSGELADLYKAVVLHKRGQKLPYEESADGARLRLSLAEFFGDDEMGWGEDGEDARQISGRENDGLNSAPVLHFLPPDAVLLPAT